MSGDIIALYRSRLSRERGAVCKRWGVKTSVALVYPNTYTVGMSNLGFQIVYQLLNRRTDVVAERVFLPEGQEMSLYLRSGKPLVSLESQQAVSSFEILAFSLSFENDYPNILKILEMGRIPASASERSDRAPLLLAGGVAAFLNPEPLTPFLDAFLLGEAEANLDRFFDFFADFKMHAPSKKELLRSGAKEVSSLYVPSLYRVEYHEDGTIKSFSPNEAGIPERISSVRDLSTEGPVPHSIIVTPDTEFADMCLMEIGRGCARSCRFCAAGFVYRPPRQRSEEQLLSTVNEVMTSHNRLGLLAAAVSDVPCLTKVTQSILERNGHFSLSSLRADSVSPEIFKQLKSIGQRTVALAPEAGSERLRKVINKHLTKDQLVEAVKIIAGTGNFTLRLYFLLGIPTETQKDVSEIVKLVKTMRHHMIKSSAKRGSIGAIKMSINCLVPKPFTPFQWFPMERLSILKEKQKWIKRALAKEGGIKVSFDVAKWAYVQTLLSVGDRRVGRMLAAAHTFEGNWKKAFSFSDINPDFFVYRPKELDEILPWDFIDHGISKKHLIRERGLALKATESEECHVGECSRCGVCNSHGKKHADR